MTRYTVITAALLLGLIPAALQAQTDPLAPAPPPVAQAATAPSAGDLQALNFYIQQNDTASIEAELRRLRVKFPGWVPPTDLAKLKVTQPSVEVDTIYRQIAAGQLAEARATIATTQAAHPDWVPASDMIKLLETAEGQLKLDAALDAGNASQALDIANNTDGLLRCDRVNNAWRIAKAQEAQQATAAAVGTYSAIVGACTSFPDISATLEKADTVTTNAELDGLFATAIARFPEKASDLTALQTRLMLGRGAAPAKISIAPDAKKRPEVRPVQRPTAAQPEVAEKAPMRSEKAAPQTAAPAQGGSGCRSLGGGGNSAPRQAERGWCAYNLDRPMDALSAFQSAEPRLTGAARRDARFGMALSYLKLNMSEEAARIAASTNLTRQQRVDVESIILNQRGVLAYKKKQYRKAIGYFDALEQVSGHLRRDLAILRGYAYLNNGNISKAQEQFQRLHDQLATPETRQALAAAAESR
ncbi:hypothetical protein [Cypionkella sp.]|uniref:hypothetical protein n=1 Tax=Cypionkella sp. TaxID=2811411 RepID=UPI00262FACD9|nr:hypothetical protein [Cypionkella sp.]MDB5666443.1 hypothetical protein [Cypionkella sp.]